MKVGLASRTMGKGHLQWSDFMVHGVYHCSRLKSSMPFKRDLAIRNIHVSKQPFEMQPQIENEDITRSPQYNMAITRTNKRRALSLQELELDD